MARKGYLAEFRRRVVALVEARRRVADVAEDLGVSQQSIYTWRRQQRVDQGLEAGTTSSDHAEIRSAKRRIRELETGLEVHRRATELLREGVCPKGGSRPSR